MKMSLNNGDWGYDFYFDDPDFPQKLYAWLHTVDSSDLMISNLVTWLAEHNVMGNAYVISEETAFYSGAERIVNQFNRYMKQLGIPFDDTELPS